MWYDHTSDPPIHNPLEPTADILTDFMKLEGELPDQQAKATLAEFLYHNPAFMMDLLGGIKMFPMQEVIIKGWMKNDYNLGVWGRGTSKSWSVAMFSIIWGIFNPRCRIVIVSFAFRAARRILEQVEKFVNDKDAILLKANFPDKLTRKTDEWVWSLPNATTIQCLPLGDGTKIRGTRADCLIVDEFAYLPENIITEVLRPFLTANNKVKEQAENREREDRMIARGMMTEEERTTVIDRKKVIFLSSACFQFEHMYKTYCEWIKKITVDPIKEPLKYEELQKSGVSYFVSRLSYEAAPDGLLNLKEIEEAKRDASEAMFDREYRAIFTGDSDGYFRAIKMAECSVKDGETPCLELTGDRAAEYVVGVDQSLSGSESSDHFAMCVMKIVTRADGKRLGMVVHSYAVAGGNLRDHVRYMFYLLTNFNVVYIAVDASQGDELEFLNICNSDQLFKTRGIQLLGIDAEFRKEDFSILPQQIKRSYNRTIGRIVQKQPFHAPFQRVANEYLQGCFDHRGILFGGKIAANGGAAGVALNADISILQARDGHEGHAEFTDMTISEFMLNQDHLLDLTRKECAMIQVRSTDLGTLQFGLPQNQRRTSGASRSRKDSYSSLLICNWGLKLYLDSLTHEIKTGMPDFPYARF